MRLAPATGAKNSQPGKTVTPPAATARVTSGDLAGVLAAAPASARDSLREAALAAYGAGFGLAALVAAAVALLASGLAYYFISERDTAPTPPKAGARLPCKTIDCRDPL